MTKKRINAPFYTERKLGIKNLFHDTRLPNGYLYSNGRNATKITAEDLPDHYIKMMVYKVDGYLSIKGIKDVVYKPNHRINHMHKDDFLYISYTTPIMSEVDERGYRSFYNYDALLWGNNILTFIRAVRKFGGYDIEPIATEVIKKEKFFMEKYPQECRPYMDILEERQGDDTSES